jgi:hypothetical protein
VACEEKPAAVLRAHLDAQQDLLHCYARLPALVLQAHSSTRLQACYVMFCYVMLHCDPHAVHCTGLRTCTTAVEPHSAARYQAYTAVMPARQQTPRGLLACKKAGLQYRSRLQAARPAPATAAAAAAAVLVLLAAHHVGLQEIFHTSLRMLRQTVPDG